ncbi:MAG: HNH endonuclease [Tistrella sp.]|uniref:HNH endonuclease family protein n=2 Tax=Tistrella mobilis TaxID=171437 RepID=I3TQH5_TISMK|nr:HNH endonuclease [Tistrella sp.]AFK55013.1 HNH endonuclease family protein [Tistrella mobilis KA081020-065]HAE45790.1 HNH endonuclease [Tistrella mobilis]MAD36993.1 HNH endonuclease [Tistrella sp.]MAM74969.1 HNH endonuclease [Tistrella sp.]MBA75092.1 HNH endonuclease [Tistrella sp.]
MGLSASTCPALVLNADYRPLSYFPLSLWSWQDAIKAVFLDRVNILSEYDSVVHSPRLEMRLPSVISLRSYVPVNRRPAFTRFNVFLRDRFRCQYCGRRFATEELTFDHVVPRARGGTTTWQNVVTACTACNTAKGARTPEQCGLTLRSVPKAPDLTELQEAGRHFPPGNLHPSWRDYLNFAGLSEIRSDEDAVDGALAAHTTLRAIQSEAQGRAFPRDMTEGEYWGVQLEDD